MDVAEYKPAIISGIKDAAGYALPNIGQAMATI